MARGKHSSASLHRRHKEAEIDNHSLRKELQKERRAHELTQRRAERAEQLEGVVERLRLDLELCTSEEVRELREQVEKLQYRWEEALIRADTFLAIGVAAREILWDGTSDVAVWERITDRAEHNYKKETGRALFADLPGHDDQSLLRVGVHDPSLAPDAVKRIQVARGLRKP